MGIRLGSVVLSASIAVAFCGHAAVAASEVRSADQKQAEQILKSMSDYLGKQDKMSFEYDSNLEIVTTENQKVGLASSGTLVLSRPSGVRATRVGGFANIEMVFDGKTVTFVNNETKEYAQEEIPGTVENLIDVLRLQYKKGLPAADLLRSDFYSLIKPSVTDIKDLGSGVIRGKECDHIALRTAFVDIELWIAQGGSPYPCRMTLTSKDVNGNPQYTVDVREFKAGEQARIGDFDFVAPAGAKQVPPRDLVDFDELPEIFKANRVGGN